jgi:hypothetical protein
MKVIQLALALLLTLPCMAQGAKPVTAAPGIIPVAEMHRLMPPSVFFQGQTATTQLRNSFGVRFGGGGLVLAGLVDTGGYSTSVRDRYQFYLLSDTPFEAGGKKLGPGAYGCGFLQDGGLLVMDLGGNELLRAPVTHDTGFARPRPLQIEAGQSSDEFRLYLGRDFITLRPAR